MIKIDSKGEILVAFPAQAAIADTTCPLFNHGASHGDWDRCGIPSHLHTSTPSILRRHSMLLRDLGEQNYVKDCLHRRHDSCHSQGISTYFACFSFRKYPLPPLWLTPSSRYDNVDYNEDHIWITLIESFQINVKKNCQIMNPYEV